jgi:hypothetical protein
MARDLKVGNYKAAEEVQEALRTVAFEAGSTKSEYVRDLIEHDPRVKAEITRRKQSILRPVQAIEMIATGNFTVVQIGQVRMEPLKAIAFIAGKVQYYKYSTSSSIINLEEMQK